MFERLMFKQIQIWQAGVLLVGFVGFVFAYGAVLWVAASGDKRFGLVGDLAIGIARLPHQFKVGANAIFKGQSDDLLATEQRFPGEAGFSFSYAAGARVDAGYLLLSRYDGDRKRSVVELVDLNLQEVVHHWLPDFDRINRESRLQSVLFDLARDNTPERGRIIHPYVTPDGAIIFQNNSPLVQIDACSRQEWMIDRLFHHSIEAHPDGGYWVPTYLEPPTVGGAGPRFIQGGIAHVSADGQILFEKSLAHILIDNSYDHFVFGQDFYSNDPLHLNDIQAATDDSPYWQRGDVFLSVRNIAAIILYRPSENRILWMKQGPWLKQHDVDILDHRRISVYDNNRANSHKGMTVRGSNNVIVYDFETDSLSAPYAEAMSTHAVRTRSEGLHEIYPNGDVLIEETNYGRTLRLGSDGHMVWSHVNRAADGQVYLVNWSRALDQRYGDRLIQTLEGIDCEKS